jgi:hypothetical protein
MDPEQRLELIALLAKDRTWDAVVVVGRALLDHYYPADIFDGSSGDAGPAYVVALREALGRLDEMTSGELAGKTDSFPRPASERVRRDQCIVP